MRGGARPEKLPAVLRAVASALPLFLLLINQAAGADAPPAPAAAVTYLERPEGGDLKGSGRKLVTSGRARHGIDINSSLDIDIDAEKIQAALLDAGGKSPAADRARELTTRLDQLGKAADELKAEAQSVRELFALWKSMQQATLSGQSAESTKRQTEFNGKLRASSNRRFAINNLLLDVRRKRLREGGMAPDAADRAAKKAFDPVLMAGPRLEFGYDWKAWRDLFDEELQLARTELEKLKPELGLKMDILAHFIPKNGEPVTVFLPGYNQAKVGQESRYEKLKFSVSDDERQLYEQYQKTAEKIGEARNAGDAVVKLLESQYVELRASLREMTGAARMAFEDSRDKLKKLQSWSSADKRKAWLESVKSNLKATPEGEKVLAAWADLDATLDEMKDDVEALEAYSKLDESLASQSPLDAMDTILQALNAIRTGDPRTAGIRVLNPDVWKKRAEKIDRFATEVQTLKAPLLDEIKKADGPYADLIAARDALKNFIAAVKESAGKVSDWIGQVVFSLPTQRAAADLPVPPEQKQLPVFGQDRLGTSANLLTIPAQRQVGDTLRIQYRFFDGATELADTGWTDTFVIQSYGWQSEVLASLAFAKQSNDPTWQPSAAISWILSKNAWPKEGENGLGGEGVKWFSGAGISAMPLNSDSKNGVELGLGATLGFLNNRILLGYGANLQSEHNKGFWFFSIRLFTFPGLSGPLGGTSSGK